MDIVPNHLGPDIAELQKTGPYIEGINCFGYKFNFEGDKYSQFVRDFIVGAALNWVVNYHCDGLRVDMTKFMCSDFTMKQMVAEVNYHAPFAFLIAEDGLFPVLPRRGRPLRMHRCLSMRHPLLLR